MSARIRWRLPSKCPQARAFYRHTIEKAPFRQWVIIRRLRHGTQARLWTASRCRTRRHVDTTRIYLALFLCDMHHIIATVLDFMT